MSYSSRLRGFVYSSWWSCRFSWFFIHLFNSAWLHTKNVSRFSSSTQQTMRYGPKTAPFVWLSWQHNSLMRQFYPKFPKIWPGMGQFVKNCFLHVCSETQLTSTETQIAQLATGQIGFEKGKNAFSVSSFCILPKWSPSKSASDISQWGINRFRLTLLQIVQLLYTTVRKCTVGHWSLVINWSLVIGHSGHEYMNGVMDHMGNGSQNDSLSALILITRGRGTRSAPDIGSFWPSLLDRPQTVNETLFESNKPLIFWLTRFPSDSPPISKLQCCY